MTAADAQQEPGRQASHEWFDRGAAAYASLFGTPPGVYVCPQCLRPFTIENLDELSIEHVPPESVGGEALLLTCKSCNNTAGHGIEAHLHYHDEVLRFASGLPVAPLPATFYVAGNPNRGEIEFADGAIKMWGVEQQNRGEEIEAIKAALPLIGDGDEIHIDFRRRIDQRAVSLAMLRAAYLATFAIFGYAYVCQTSLDPIRSALNADDGSLVLPVLFRAEGQRGDRAIVKVAEPEWLAEAVVVLIDQALIVLPPLLGGDLDTVAELAARRGDPSEPQGNFRIAHPYGWPTQPGHGFDVWVIEHRDG